MLVPLNFPNAVDDFTNLYEVKDSLRLVLSQDYNPGDTSITVELNQTIMDLFPDSGLISLVENCSEPQKRIISFYYTSKTDVTFDGITILGGFIDSYKPKNVTHVLQNVMAEHHNAIKDSIKLIQEYLGLADEKAMMPYKGNINQRINYLYSIAYMPKAWFSADNKIGVVPLTVNFTDESFRLGANIENNPITFTWDFGDNNISQINYSVTSNVGNATHTYQRPGLFDVTLKVTNKYGSDTLKFPAYINVKYPAPDFAVINYTLSTFQQIVNDQIKIPIETVLSIFVPPGINPLTGKTYSGEEVNQNNVPIDPITTYTWLVSDNYPHTNTQSTDLLYSSGGIYDVVLRVDTVSLAYTNTVLSNYVNVIELTNLWLYNFDSYSTSVVRASEFGFISEAFKTRQNASLNITSNYNFLINTFNSEQAIREFSRNTFLSSSSSLSSGYAGTSNICYATGRNGVEPTSAELIQIVEYNGFNESYAEIKNIVRPWNWIAFNKDFETYFLFGNPTTQPVNLSLTNQTMIIYNQLSNATSSYNFSINNYISAASELQQNIAEFNDACDSLYGYFSVYRYAWRDRNGYFVRNSGVGSFFQLNSFYQTVENGADLIFYFKKLNNVAGPEKLEGQLVNLTSGLYFFNNSGSVSAYDTATESWQIGGITNPVEFAQYQDRNFLDFNNAQNTLLATTDNDHNAFLSFDYTYNSFLRFSDIDLSFSKLSERPNYSQWLMGTF